MAIGKPRGREGKRPVYVYRADLGRKVYVGSRKALRGPGGAQELEREKQAEFAESGSNRTEHKWTCERYAQERWLPLKHGPNTRRPSPTTLQVNRDSLKPFLRDFGARDMTSIARMEALDWAKQHPRQVKAVSALFNDAVDDQIIQGNPFANRRSEQPRGRKDINPLTEQEVDRLAEIARDMWGEYGRVVAGWILFLAWVGCRPGEAFKARWDDVDLQAGEFKVKRIKPPYNEDVIVLPRRAQQALLDMPVQHHGLLFTTITGKPMSKGNAGYVWRPVAAALMAGLSPSRRAELGKIDPYSLRHHCASILADRGCNEYEIAAMLGNSPAVCRETYIHSFKDRTKDRLRLVLDGPSISDLDAARQRKMGGSK